jgi:protein SCO1
MSMSSLPALLIAILLSLVSPAQAGITAADLSQVGVASPTNAQIPSDAIWQDEGGAAVRLANALHERPSVLIFADFTCSTLCGPILSVAAGLLTQTGLRPGRDFGLIVLGLDAKDRAADALAFKQQIGDRAISAATIMLRSDALSVRQAAQAVGYHFVYDAEHDQYAHPAALLILTADGHVARVLSGLGLSANDLNLALVEAGQGRVGSLGDRIRLMCYGFDVSLGAYTPLIRRSLIIGTGITLVLLAGFLLRLSWRLSL